MPEKPDPLWYPDEVFFYADEAERQDILAGNAEYLDHRAADLLAQIADAPRGCWADPAHAVRCRRVLLQVVDWLRTRSQ